MKPERFQQVEALYHAALERLPQERAAYLDQACAGDAALRAEVQSLLDQEGKLSGLLESPAIEVAARLLASEEREKTSGALRVKSVSHYSILERIGAGGMGEVYRARDTKLNRSVALKVLPEILSRDPERMARFKREAQVLASLNHPNIATIYGFEESESVRALAMELVEGPTLAERLGVGRGALRAPEGGQAPPLPIDDALPIAKQIAEGLEYAHERGIVHRDLKPANIKVTPEGTVKILDFGLAKALDTSVAAASSPPSAMGTSPLQDSPTLSMAATQAGVILGTAAYMSPEQARGKTVDRRADIWSFGCVLFEMLSSKRIFEGESVSDTLAAVLKDEPDWDALPATTPPRICEVVRRCLVKDPKQRLRDIGDARIAIEDTISGVGAIHELPLRAKAGEHRSPLQRVLPWAAGIVLGAILAGLTVWRYVSIPAPAPRPVEKFTITLPAGDELASLRTQALALSPDGSKLVYVAQHENSAQLYLRPLDQLEAQPLPGTDDAEFPFFSPDGQWIGFKPFFSLNKVSSKGGPPARIAGIGGDLGATWSEDGTITVAKGTGELVEVPAAGGAPRPLMEREHSAANTFYRWPQALPGDAVLFNSAKGSNWAQARIEVFSPKTGERRVLLEGGTCPHYVAPGYIVFQRDAQLMAVPFDLKSLKITGEPAPTLVHVRTDPESGAAQFALSDNGTLAYVPGGAVAPESRLAWADRKGNEEPIPAPPRNYGFPHLSPDGTRVAFCAGEPGDIWVYDLRRGTLTQVTPGESDRRLAWSPDGRKIAYGSFRGGAANIFWINADGSGEEQLTTAVNGLTLPYSFSPDGRLLAYYGEGGIWVLPLAGDRKPQFWRSGAVPEFSPNGRWISYSLCAGEPCQLYVAPYPGPGEQEQVSVSGGWESRWSPDGREILWGWDRKVMAVSVTPAGSTLKLGNPQVLFQTKGGFEDVSPDGKRFLMIKPQPSASATQINVILNWTEELKRVATGPSR